MSWYRIASITALVAMSAAQLWQGNADLSHNALVGAVILLGVD